MTDPVAYASTAELEFFTRRVFVASGLSVDHAVIAARAMLDADLAGVDTHGVIRLSQYAADIRAGRIDVTAEPSLVRTAATMARIEGFGAMGHVCMSMAADAAADIAAEYGTAWVGTVRSNHAGALGVYAARLAERGFIAICGAVSGINQVAPWGGVEPLLGTNPIAFAVPAGDEPAVVFDMATSVASFGTVKKYALEGRTLREGWMVDRKTGETLTDPSRFSEGLLTPLGEHKGSGLALILGLLAGVANGADFGRSINEKQAAKQPVNTGQFVIAIDASHLHSGFVAAIDLAIREFAGSTPLPGGPAVRVPGMQRARTQRERAAAGIPVGPELRRELEALAAMAGVAPLVLS